MRALLVLVITWMVLAPEIVTTAQAAPPNRVNVSYLPPKNPAHQPIYEQLKPIRNSASLRGCDNFSLRSDCRAPCW